MDDERTITFDGVSYAAVICPRCPGLGAMYPASSLPAHMARHDMSMSEKTETNPQQALHRHPRRRRSGVQPSVKKPYSSKTGVEKTESINRQKYHGAR